MLYKRKRKISKSEPIPVPRAAQSRIDLLYSKPIKMKYVKSAISLLTHSTNIKSKTKGRHHCLYHDKNCDPKTNGQSFGIYLRSRAPNYIAHQLRHAILLHDWETAAQIVLLIIRTGTKWHTNLIAKACVVILMNHPNASSEVLTEFLRGVTQYMDDEDIMKFVVLMCTLRENLLESNEARIPRMPLIKNTLLTAVEFSNPVFKQDI